MKRAHRLVGLVLLAAATAAAQTPAPAPAGVRTFKVDDAWGRDTVRFETAAPMETIVGTTNQITGTLSADPNDLKGAGTNARLEVDLKSIKTGIEMRDGHTHKALGAEKQPKAVFTLTKVKSASAASLAPNAPVDAVAEGSFELNGVKKAVEVPLRITYVPKETTPFSKMRPGNFVRVTTTFPIALADFGVSRSGPVLMLQVSETAQVSVSILASDASPEEAEQYRQNAVKYMGKAAR